MEEDKQKSMSVILSDDVVEEILKYLPERSLARFNCVSKKWRSVIRSTLKVLVVEEDSIAGTLLLETFSRDHDNNGQICRSSSSSCIIPDHSIGEFHLKITIRVWGSCEGLVLISIYGCNYIYLINPKTMEQRTLSSTLLLHMNANQQGPIYGLPFAAGFGKDIITGSYKVILMYEYNHNRRVRVEILSLNNEEQRDAGEFPVFSNQLCDEQTSVFINGSLFWLTKPFREYSMPSPTPSRLVAMDLHTERFRSISLPSWYIKYSRGMRMWSLIDRLCLSDVLQCSNFDVWSLQQEHPKEKWEKIYSFNILNIGRLNPSFWTLGLAAAYFRKTRERRPAPRNRTSLDHLRTIVYTPTLISPYQL